MDRANKMQEKLLYNIWQSKDFNKDLITIGGEHIVILDPGFENKDLSGPDFKNARLRIGNLVYVGDIEIDSDIHDWKNHSHNRDNNYNSVILHICLTNKSNYDFVLNNKGRKIPTLCLSNFINSDILKAFHSSTTKSSQDKVFKCYPYSLKIDLNLKLDYIYKLGLERFKRKCDRIYYRLKELSYVKDLNLKEPVIRYDMNSAFISREFTSGDFETKEIWQQLLYELIFEVLGYSKNKNSMLKLAQHANIRTIKPMVEKAKALIQLRAILFYTSGLLPYQKLNRNDNAYFYVEDMKRFLNLIKNNYDGNLLSREEWVFYKTRPSNFPVIRIAGGAVLLLRIIFEDVIGTLIKYIENISDNDFLVKTLKSIFMTRTDGIWETHYNFTEAAEEKINYFIGSSRADEIVINALLPFISVYAEVFGYRELSKKVVALYTTYLQFEGNTTITLVSNYLSLSESWKKSIIAQGTLELYKNFCVKRKCYECSIDRYCKELISSGLSSS